MALLSKLCGLVPMRTRKARVPRVPDDVLVFAIGDVHGCLDQLLWMEEQIRSRLVGRAGMRAVVVYLGDYIDRGPDSAGVLAHLSEPPDDGIERRFLLGNHEEILLRALRDPATCLAWRDVGGAETLMSYGIDVPRMMTDEDALEAAALLGATLPAPQRRFLARLERMIVIGDYLFVHAGLRPRVPLARQNPSDLLWIRDEFLEYRDPFEHFVVHGHTPAEDPEHLPNRLNLDTGAYLTGRLTAVELDQDRREILQVRRFPHARPDRLAVA